MVAIVTGTEEEGYLNANRVNPTATATAPTRSGLLPDERREFKVSLARAPEPSKINRSQTRTYVGVSAGKGFGLPSATSGKKARFWALAGHKPAQPRGF